MKTRTFNLPAHWAPPLINGDYSGCTDAEAHELDDWLDAHPEVGGCLSCNEEAEYRRYHDAPGVLPCDCLYFTFSHRPPESREHGFLQHGAAPGPFRTERVSVKPDEWPHIGQWLAFYEGKWRRVHVQVRRTFIVYRGERITIQIDGV